VIPRNSVVDCEGIAKVTLGLFRGSWLIDRLDLDESQNLERCDRVEHSSLEGREIIPTQSVWHHSYTERRNDANAIAAIATTRQPRT